MEAAAGRIGDGNKVKGRNDLIAGLYVIFHKNKKARTLQESK